MGGRKPFAWQYVGKSDFMYFTLGFIFYKYLSEKIEKYANSTLEDDEVTFKELWNMTDADAMELQEEVKNQCLENIGYFIEPKYLFLSVIDTIKLWAGDSDVQKSIAGVVP